MEEAKPQTLLWTVPECPFRVTVPAPLINDIRILAVEAFYSVPRGGVEIGGVFFGVRERDAIHIQAQRPVRCQYATGPSFTLSVDDQLGLSGLLQGAIDDPDLAGMSPLGWYHSHTRSEIFLSPVDLQLYNDFFHERWQISLVMRPANLQPTKAGIFFRDRSGNLKFDAPIQEFKLESPSFGLALFDSENLPALPAPLPAPPPAPVNVPSPELAAPISLPSVQPAAVVVAAVAGNGSVAVAAPPPEITPAIVPEPVPGPVAEKPRPEPPIPMPFVEPGLHSFNIAEAAARERRRVGWMWAMVILMLLTLGGGAAFLKWGRVTKQPGLGLETYDINGAFLIRWDRESTTILGASHATLEIEDGAEKTPIELTPTELSAGGYGYLRRTPQVSVRMKVDGPSPVEEYSNFKGIQVTSSPPPQTQTPIPDQADAPEPSKALAKALEDKDHLKTELLNESMVSSDLRREITSLRKQLAEARAKPPAR